MLGVGAQVPAVRVWSDSESTDEVVLSELVAEGPVLILFYLWDWTKT